MSRRDTPSAPACADGAALPAAELIERRHELCRAKYIEMANCVDSSMNATGQTVLNENHFIRLLQSLRVRRVAVAYSNKEKEKQDSVGQKDRLQSTRKISKVELGSVSNSCGFVDHATRASAATSAERMTAPEEKPAAPEATAACEAATVVSYLVATASASVVHPASARLAT